MKKYYLTRTKRDSILDTCTDAQREFLHNHVKRGIATVFTRELAATEGAYVTNEMSRDEVAQHLKQWAFHDYQDAGPAWQRTSNLRCECGKQLRYQFSVRHKGTKEILRFGETHFAEHMHLPPRVVQAIKSGLADAVDYELDELLMKIQDKWTLPFRIPESFILPQDIQDHLAIGIPLLDRQVVRLRELMPRPLVKSPPDPPAFPQHNAEESDRQPLPTFQPRSPMSTDLPENLKPRILQYVEAGMTSARQLADRLIADGLAPNNRSATALPDIYVPVVTFLRGLPGYQVIPITERKDCVIQRRE